MITSPDNVFYANQNHKTYQSVNSEVLIKAILSPEGPVGTRVYFRILDPPDQSNYLEGVDNDNNYSFLNEYENIFDPSLPLDIKLKPKNQTDFTFDNSLQYSQIYSIESNYINGVHTAELILEFTKVFAGNNYIIEASLDINFEKSIRTPVMVGWKRQIIQEKSMFKTGTSTNEESNGGNTITVFRFDQEDIQVNDQVIVYGVNDDGVILQIETTVAGLLMPTVEDEVWKITFQDLQGTNFPRFSGVVRKTDILNDENEIITNSYFDEENIEMYFNQAFGFDNCGLDGGAFIEYSFIDSSKDEFKDILPLLPFDINGPLSTVDNTTFANFLMEWNGNPHGSSSFFCNWVDKSPIFSNEPGKAGLGWPELNNFVIYVSTLEESPVGNFDRRLNNTVIHEMGHQNGVGSSTNSHVDGSHFDNHQHDEDESCIMSSPANSSSYNYINEIFEFDIDDNSPHSCLKAIRNTKTN